MNITAQMIPESQCHSHHTHVEHGRVTWFAGLLPISEANKEKISEIILKEFRHDDLN